MSDAVVTLIEMGKNTTDMKYVLLVSATLKSDDDQTVFVAVGFNVDTLPVYAKRSQRMVITARKDASVAHLYSLCVCVRSYVF